MAINSDIVPFTLCGLDEPEPIPTRTYYAFLCDLHPEIQKHFIVSDLSLYKSQNSDKKHEFTVATIVHRRQTVPEVRLLIERNPDSSSFSDIASTVTSPMTIKANDMVHCCTEKSFQSFIHSRKAKHMHQLIFNTSPSSPDTEICKVIELFRLISIISSNSEYYVINKDMCWWFAGIIMETAHGIFSAQRTILNGGAGVWNGIFNGFEAGTARGQDIIAQYLEAKSKCPIPVSPQRAQEIAQLEQQRVEAEERDRKQKEKIAQLEQQRVEAEERNRKQKEEIEQLHRRLAAATR